MRPLCRPALLLLSALLLSGVACTSPPQEEDDAPARPPSFVYIMADDLGWADLGSYGQTRIATPRLDRMAAEGTRFTQYYAGSTVCAPSRATLMLGQHTGQRPDRVVPLAPRGGWRLG